MRKTFLILAAFLPTATFAFNVEGFTTGMSKEDVIIAAKKSRELRVMDDSTIRATSADGGYLSFTFCQDRLVAVQQGFAATLPQVALLMAELNSKHGDPLSADAGAHARPTGPLYEFGLVWKAGTEYVKIYYSGNAQSEALSALYQARNKCFKVPR